MYSRGRLITMLLGKLAGETQLGKGPGEAQDQPRTGPSPGGQTHLSEAGLSAEEKASEAGRG